MSPVYSARYTKREATAVRKQRHKKDFSWDKRAKNPYKTPQERKVLRERITVVLLIILIFATFGVIFYHPMFQVETIHTTGLQRISEQEFIDASIGIFDSFSPLFIVPGKNYFFLNIDKTTEILSTRFPLASVSITKSFPNQVSIAVTEKVSTIIYDNGVEYSYVGLDGDIVETIRTVGENEWIEKYNVATSTLADGTVTSTRTLTSRVHTIEPAKVQAEMGEYPLIYHIDAPTQNGTDTPLQHVLSSTVVEQILTWHQKSQVHQHIPEIYYIVVAEEGRNTRIMLDPYRYILIDATESAHVQMDRLKRAQTEVDIDAINYIDLRFDGRVYWQ